MPGTTSCSKRGQRKSQIISSLEKWESGEEEGEGNHLFKTHEACSLLFAIKEERGSVKM